MRSAILGLACLPSDGRSATGNMHYPARLACKLDCEEGFLNTNATYT